jgi:polyhydroxybutyrate depolymerase
MILLYISFFLFVTIILYQYFFGQGFIKKPNLQGQFLKADLISENIKRKYAYFLPSHLKKETDLIFALHGAQDNGIRFRKRLGYEFDKIAERKNIIIVYPNGYKKSWNDCRKEAKYPSKKKNINDIKFLQKIEKEISLKHDLRIKSVFIFGYSNGGQLANKISLEYPEWISGAAIMCANLPTDENMDCIEKKVFVPIIYVNGTNDKTNPFNGGLVNVLNFTKLGYVRSAEATVNYWITIANIENKQLKIIHFNPSDKKTSVEKRILENENKTILVHYVAHRAGHTIPNIQKNFPRILGLTNHDVNMVKESIDFFKQC